MSAAIDAESEPGAGAGWAGAAQPTMASANAPTARHVVRFETDISIL
jgi:hypothetical protein